jgi:hypothetical protein
MIQYLSNGSSILVHTKLGNILGNMGGAVAAFTMGQANCQRVDPPDIWMCRRHIRSFP